MWASASDWALRRLLKVLLKRNLKGVLETELDVEQLHVSLGRGAAGALQGGGAGLAALQAAVPGRVTVACAGP